MKEPKDWWQSHYGAALPIAHRLRFQVPDRWFRIHSLPQSKRYPQKPSEYSGLLARHNTVATDILGSQSLCLLLVGRYHEQPDLHSRSQSLPNLEGINFTLFDTWEEPRFISVWCAPVTWIPGQYNGIIKAVADDEEANIVFASLQTGEAYAPYDGGADLFLASTARRDQLKQRYADWLSKHPQGV